MKKSDLSCQSLETLTKLLPSTFFTCSLSTGKLSILAYSDIRFADFHTELERVSAQDQQNQYIKFAITLEQSLAVGNYSDLIESRKHSPEPSFNVFLDRINDTIR